MDDNNVFCATCTQLLIQASKYLSFNKTQDNNRMKTKTLGACYYIAIGILALMYTSRNTGYAVDDSFITFRYAYNLKEGFGLTFNVGEYYYGTTAAGYAITLAILYGITDIIATWFNLKNMFTFDIPFIATLLSSVSISYVAVCLPTIAAPNRSLTVWVFCLICTCFLFAAKPFNEVSGHETYIYLSLAFSGVMLMAYGNYRIMAALLLAFAVTIRPDAILFAFIALFLEWVKSGTKFAPYLIRRGTIKFISVYMAVVVTWLIFLHSYFGTFIPGTLGAKKVQATMGYWPIYNFETLEKYIVDSLGHRASILVSLGTISWLASLASRLIQKKPSNPSDMIAASWILFGIISAVTYITLNVTFWPWYGVPLTFSFMVAGFIGWINIITFAVSYEIDSPTMNKMRLYLSRLASLLFLVSLSDAPSKLISWANTRNKNEHINAYSEIIEYIKKSSPTGARVQLAEPGSFGYHLGPKYFVIDELGLATPGEAAALAKKEYSWTINKWKPDYLVCSFRGVYSACENNLQEKNYVLVGEFNTSFWRQYGGHGAQLYKRTSITN